MNNESRSNSVGCLIDSRMEQCHGGGGGGCRNGRGSKGVLVRFVERVAGAGSIDVRVG